ncbi:MAG: glycosyltransferase [Pelagimonas sp.]|uniref:glycosyltransferase n=1 Tax=Pelagimonas sp. TaxID=2073170 RepID=UPI003D6C5ACE
MAKTDLRLAYLCDRTSAEHLSLGHAKSHMFDALSAHVSDVVDIPVSEAGTRLPRHVASQIQRGNFDVVFCGFTLVPLHKLDLPRSTVIAAAPHAIRGLPGPAGFNLRWLDFGILNRPVTRWRSRRDRAALKALDLILWPTDDVLNAAQSLFELSATRSFVLPWGANGFGATASVSKMISYVAPVQLLFIGRDWPTCGGAVAFETLNILRMRGVDARLTVIGCIPPDTQINEWMTVHPFLNLEIEDERNAYQDILCCAHFLLRPTVKGYGFTCCDASACGLPVLCYQLGHTPVRDGVNGHVLPVGSSADQFANWVLSYLDSPGAFLALSRTAQIEFNKSLNWNVWGQKTAEILAVACQSVR